MFNVKQNVMLKPKALSVEIEDMRSRLNAENVFIIDKEAKEYLTERSFSDITLEIMLCLLEEIQDFIEDSKDKS